MASPQLKDLHSAMIATLSGYKEAKVKSEDAALSDLCNSVIQLRSKHHEEIHSILAKRDEKADDEPGIMAKVQEIVIDARSAITGIDKDTLPSFIRGEKSIVAKYDDALEEVIGDSGAVAVLNKQKADIISIIRKMEAIKPSDT